MPTKGAVNFHDGPLPRYAGLNAPVWALIAGEERHGITWHMIEGGIDEGDILQQRLFDIAPTDTALTLNAKCYAAAIDSFPALAEALTTGAPARQAQDLSQSSYFGLHTRPDIAGRLDFTRPATTLNAHIRALDHGDYWNPLVQPKFELAGRVVLTTKAALAEGQGAPGTVLSVGDGQITVATGAGALSVSRITDCTGAPVAVERLVKPGDILPSATPEQAAAVNAATATAIKAEPYWRKLVETLSPAILPLSGADTGEVAEQNVALPAGISADQAFAAMALLAGRLCETANVDCAWRDADTDHGAPAGYVAPWVPVRVDASGTVNEAMTGFATSLDKARRFGGYPSDMTARLPSKLRLATPHMGLTDQPALVPGTVLTLSMTDGTATLRANTARLPETMLTLMAARLEKLLSEFATLTTQSAKTLDIMPQAERTLVLHDWNATKVEYNQTLCIHQMFERQVAKTPDATALVFEGDALSYAELNARSNQVAHVLREMGVKPGTLVGLYTQRSPSLLIGALGILKAGGADRKSVV